MNATDRIAAVPEQDRPDDASSQPGEERMTAHRPATAKRERRFEFGFFIRKIVNGWVAFYRQFPPEQRASVFTQVHGRPAREDRSSEQTKPGATALMHSRTGETSDGEVLPLAGTGPVGGDPGPVGGTSYEAGFFARTLTSGSDDPDA